MEGAVRGLLARADELMGAAMAVGLPFRVFLFAHNVHSYWAGVAWDDAEQVRSGLHNLKKLVRVLKKHVATPPACENQLDAQVAAILGEESAVSMTPSQELAVKQRLVEHEAGLCLELFESQYRSATELGEAQAELCYELQTLQKAIHERTGSLEELIDEALELSRSLLATASGMSVD